MALSINYSQSDGYDVYEFANRGTHYTLLRRIGTNSGVDVWTRRAALGARNRSVKVYDSVEEFEKTAKFLKGISLLIK